MNFADLWEFNGDFLDNFSNIVSRLETDPSIVLFGNDEVSRQRLRFGRRRICIANKSSV